MGQKKNNKKSVQNSHQQLLAPGDASVQLLGTVVVVDRKQRSHQSIDLISDGENRYVTFIVHDS